MPELEDEGGLNFNEIIARGLGFLIRRRWWILAPFCCVALCSIALLSFIPNRYTSAAKLLVVQQQVSERYVTPNSETDLNSELQAMKQEILSRTQLLQMIDQLDLFPQERKRLSAEELVALMLSNVVIAPVGDNLEASQGKNFNAFYITFTTRNPFLAQQVTTHLTSLFTNAYLRTQTEQATNTTDFLHRQVEDKGKELEVQEARLKDFKLSHVGELPEQQAGNLGILTGLHNQLSSTMTGIENAQQEKALKEVQLEAAMRRRPAVDGGFGTVVPGDARSAQTLSPVQVAQNELTTLHAKRNELQLKGYTPEHPDVIRNQRAIAEAETKLAEAKAQAPTPEKEPATARSASARTAAADDAADDPMVIQLKSALEANRVHLENLTKEESRLKTSISQYENRLNETPVREQQEAGILRDTEVLRSQYAELQKREQESQLATNLAKQQGGRQFRLIDPASFPTVPSYPKRLSMSLKGAAFGFALGLALAFFIEMRDTSYWSETDLVSHVAPPFVLGVPLLPTAREKRRKNWQILFQWAGASMMLMVVLAAEVLVYLRDHSTH